MDEYDNFARKMIERLREHYKITDEQVLDAMNAMCRVIFFVPTAIKNQAYKDNALPIAGQQTISQPFIVARMTELLELSPEAKVLEIGAGSGYQTAILSQIAQAKFLPSKEFRSFAKKRNNRLTRLGIQQRKFKMRRRHNRLGRLRAV